MFNEIGGEVVINKLVDDFYQIMSHDPNAKECFETHAGRDINDSAQKLKAFLSGWTGGPQLYLETYGHPRLRMRHFPFKIGKKEGEQWLYCMNKALSLSSINSELQSKLMVAFQNVVMMLTEGRG
jgi:hemoglobin